LTAINVGRSGFAHLSLQHHGKWSGTEVLIDGEGRLIMKEADVFGVIEEDARSSARAA